MAAKDSDINAAQKQELEDSTSCGICLEIYKCPKLLPCGHTFCMNCIQETGLKRSKGPGDKMPCPLCRQPFRIPSDGFAGLQNNYYIESLVRVAQILDPSCGKCLKENRDEVGKDVQRADMYCTNCKQKLCEECCRHHRKLKLTKNHKLISINGQRPTHEELMQSLVPSACELHNQDDLKMYCCICKTALCAICFTEHHKVHKGTHVTKAAVEFRKEIANNVEEVKTYINQVEMKRSELIMAKQELHKKLESIQSDVNGKKDSIKQMAEKHANSLLEELFSIQQSIMKEIDTETDNIDAQLTRLESYNSSCQEIMTTGSAGDICRSVGDLSASLNELQQGNQSLTERQLKPFSLCFEETEFEEENEHNMIGQLKEEGHLKQMTSTKHASISVFTVLHQSHDSLLFSASNSVTIIEVKLGEVTKMGNMDAVVRCTNHQLDIDGPLSDQIISLSGPNVRQELLSHKQRLPFLPTGFLVHTSAGNLKGVKAIIHVVRPEVHEFSINDHRSMYTLRNVFANCLRYTKDELRLKSICLPPIGFERYGAKMVVDCFLDAVEALASTVVNGNPSAAAQHQPNPHHLNYIQLFSCNLHWTQRLIHCIKQRLGAQ